VVSVRWHEERVDIHECAFVKEVIACVGRAAVKKQHSSAVVPGNPSGRFDLRGQDLIGAEFKKFTWQSSYGAILRVGDINSPEAEGRLQ
jgi:hypothetical protein